MLECPRHIHHTKSGIIGEIIMGVLMQKYILLLCLMPTFLLLVYPSAQ